MGNLRLDALLRVRKIQRDQAAASSADTQAALCAQDRRAAQERRLLEQSGGAESFAAAGLARAAAHAQLAEIAAVRRVAAGEAERAEESLRLARRALRSAELLHERHEQVRAEMRARQEQAGLDELAGIAHHRRDRG